MLSEFIISVCNKETTDEQKITYIYTCATYIEL